MNQSSCCRERCQRYVYNDRSSRYTVCRASHRLVSPVIALLITSVTLSGGRKDQTDCLLDVMLSHVPFSLEEGLSAGLAEGSDLCTSVTWSKACSDGLAAGAPLDSATTGKTCGTGIRLSDILGMRTPHPTRQRKTHVHAFVMVYL